MDIMMPVMDGPDAVKQVRALENSRGILSTFGVKIIITTAVDDLQETILCLKGLCDAYMRKPISLPELLTQIKSMGLLKS
jgi:two-component system chemotaxis response regulator CheY